MALPRLPDYKIAAIKKLKAEGLTIEGIEEQMKRQGMKVGRASVAKYAKDFRVGCQGANGRFFWMCIGLED